MSELAWWQTLVSGAAGGLLTLVGQIVVQGLVHRHQLEKDRIDSDLAALNKVEIWMSHIGTSERKYRHADNLGQVNSDLKDRARALWENDIVNIYENYANYAPFLGRYPQLQDKVIAMSEAIAQNSPQAGVRHQAALLAIDEVRARIRQSTKPWWKF